MPLKCQLQAEGVTHQPVEKLPKSPHVVAVEKRVRNIGEVYKEVKKREGEKKQRSRTAVFDKVYGQKDRKQKVKRRRKIENV